MSELVLNLSHVGKRYAEYDSTLARVATWFGAKIPTRSEFWALSDISFTVSRGEAVALIGQNGAGKSTLLKIITGTVRPTRGRVAVGGRINAILELGLGFNPELSGRQNVFLAGGFMGFSQRDLAAMMPAIEAFAEIGPFFDQPMRIYSSGMHARLAFALVTAQRPDILIVDEILSVGDSYFQHKSFDRIRQFKNEGSSIVLVSHAMADVRTLCDRVILLERGRLLKDGRSDEVVDYYSALIAAKEKAKLSIEQRRNAEGWLFSEYGTMEARVDSVELLDADTGAPVKLVTVGQKIIVETKAHAIGPINRLVLGHRITDRAGHVVWGSNTWHSHQVIRDAAAGEKFVFRLAMTCNLGPGSYAISFGLVSSDTHLENCFHKVENSIVFDVINADRLPFVGVAALDAKISVNRLGVLTSTPLVSQPQRIAVISTPRSGNTWLRLLLADLYKSKAAAVHTPSEIPWPELPDHGIALQLHWDPTPEFIDFLTRNHFKVVTIARHPLDVLISILQFAPKEPQTARWLAGAGGSETPILGERPGSPAFLAYALSPRAKCLLGVTPEWWWRAGTLSLRYEDLIRDPTAALNRLAEYIGAPEQPVAEVLARHRFDALKQGDVNGHFWQGRAGLWSYLITAERARQIFAVFQDRYGPLGYDVNDADENLTAEEADARWNELTG